jgi:hypothetical protein
MVFDIFSISVLLVLFMINSVVQYRIGFKNGSVGGHVLGVYHTAKWLVENDALDCENKDTGRKSSIPELTSFLWEKTRQAVLNDKTNKDDLEAIIELNMKKNLDK